MRYLKADTAVDVKIGPFLDITNGNTPETGLTATQASIRLSKMGGDFAAKDSATSASHDEFGWYDCNISGTDTNTEGRMVLACHISGSALPVWHEFMVVNANVYDSLFATATTDYLQTDVIQISGDATAPTNLESMYDGTGYVGGTTKLGIDVVKVSGDATVADNLETIYESATLVTNFKNMYDGTGYVGGTALLTVDIEKIDGDATAAANLETMTENATAAGEFLNMFDGTGFAGGTIKLEVDVAKISGDATAAANLEIMTEDSTVAGKFHDAFDDSTGYGFTGCTMPTTTAITNDVNADVVKIHGDATAASNAEQAFDTNGYAFTGCTMPTTTDVTNAVSVTATVNADVIKIDGDATAANNLETMTENATMANNFLNMYDGTGYGGGTTKLGVDIVKISGDATAPDNLELMYDGTGYAGGTTKLNVNVAAEDNIDFGAVKKASINTEVADVIKTDTKAEPGQGAPPATASIEEKISWVYAYLRNKKTQTATLLTLRNDADDDDIMKATVSDDGTTFTQEEFVSG